MVSLVGKLTSQKRIAETGSYPPQHVGELANPALAQRCYAVAERNSPAVHHGVRCDRSGMAPIVGMRYHLPGQDYDLCQASASARSKLN